MAKRKKQQERDYGRDFLTRSQARISRGMSFYGGDLLFIEVTRMPGKGSMVLTGQLGDVMKESAQAALSYVRTHAERLGIAPAFFKDHADWNTEFFATGESYGGHYKEGH